MDALDRSVSPGLKRDRIGDDANPVGSSGHQVLVQSPHPPGPPDLRCHIRHRAGAEFVGFGMRVDGFGPEGKVRQRTLHEVPVPPVVRPAQAEPPCQRRRNLHVHPRHLVVVDLADLLAPSAGQAVLSGRSRILPMVGTSEGSRVARTGGKHADAPAASEDSSWRVLAAVPERSPQIIQRGASPARGVPNNGRILARLGIGLS